MVVEIPYKAEAGFHMILLSLVDKDLKGSRKDTSIFVEYAVALKSSFHDVKMSYIPYYVKETCLIHRLRGLKEGIIHYLQKYYNKDEN